MVLIEEEVDNSHSTISHSHHLHDSNISYIFLCTFGLSLEVNINHNFAKEYTILCI